MSTFKEEADYLDMWIDRTKKAEAQAEAAEAKLKALQRIIRLESPVAENEQRRAERAEELADKYKWQVRDTCTRAEAAERKLRALQEAVEDALRQTRNTKCIRLLEPALAQSKE